MALSGRPTLTLVALDANTPVPARPVPAVAEAFLALLQPVVIAVPHPMPHRSTRGRFAVAHVQVSCARARGEQGWQRRQIVVCWCMVVALVLVLVLPVLVLVVGALLMFSFFSLLLLVEV